MLFIVHEMIDYKITKDLLLIDQTLTITLSKIALLHIDEYRNNLIFIR